MLCLPVKSRETESQELDPDFWYESETTEEQYVTVGVEHLGKRNKSLRWSHVFRSERTQ